MISPQRVKKFRGEIRPLSLAGDGYPSGPDSLPSLHGKARLHFCRSQRLSQAAAHGRVRISWNGGLSAARSDALNFKHRRHL